MSANVRKLKSLVFKLYFPLMGNTELSVCECDSHLTGLFYFILNCEAKLNDTFNQTGKSSNLF